MDDVMADETQPGARTCASCGASLRPDARFCASCGNWIGAPEPVEEPEEPSPPVPAFEELKAVEDPEERQDPEELHELDELQEPDEIEEITELHPIVPPPRPGVQPVSLSREPMTRPRRVLLAIALLMLFGAIAVALRTIG
jgi:hypothetical protein